jgi:hypothetical protein
MAPPMATMNKFLAKNNKSRHEGRATKNRGRVRASRDAIPVSSQGGRQIAA